MTTIGFFGEGPVQRPKLQKPAPKKIEQWVSKVTGFSSQYDAAGWAAASVCGAPQVYPKYGDVRGAWAPQSVGKQEWIEVAFLEQVEVEKIEIYETNCPGSIIKVAGMTDAGWVDLWKGEKDLALMTSAKEARIFTIEPQIPGVVTNSLRINMSCEGAPSWCEIDCIRLTGGHNVRRVDSEPVPELDDLASDWFQLLENSERTDCILYIHQSNNPASSSEASSSSSSSSSSGKKGDDQDLLNPPVSPEKPRRKGKAEVEEIAEEFRLHKVVLFQRCPVLEAKFKSTGSSVLHLTTDNPDIWVEFLAFVYTNTTEISTEKAMGLLELSIEYDLPALEDLCTNFLVKNWLHASTADAFLTYATQINAQKLLKHCQAISSSSSSS